MEPEAWSGRIPGGASQPRAPDSPPLSETARPSCSARRAGPVFIRELDKPQGRPPTHSDHNFISPSPLPELLMRAEAESPSTRGRGHMQPELGMALPVAETLRRGAGPVGALLGTKADTEGHSPPDFILRGLRPNSLDCHCSLLSGGAAQRQGHLEGQLAPEWQPSAPPDRSPGCGRGEEVAAPPRGRSPHSSR